MTDQCANLEPYIKPELVKHENIKYVTKACANWQCSISVPGTYQ